MEEGFQGRGLCGFNRPWQESDSGITRRPREELRVFALLNVQARIAIYYGETAELKIVSGEGNGTVAVIDLPADRCREERGEAEHESHDC